MFAEDVYDECATFDESVMAARHLVDAGEDERRFDGKRAKCADRDPVWRAGGMTRRDERNAACKMAHCPTKFLVRDHSFSADEHLAKDISDLLHKGRIREIFGFDLGKLFEDLALLFGERFRRYDGHRDEKVAFPTAAEIRHSLPFDAKDRARLRARRDLQRFFAIERADGNFVAERRLCERDRLGRIEILSLTLKTSVFFDVQDDVEIAGRPAADAGFAFA